jgi:hypothetical protein
VDFVSASRLTEPGLSDVSEPPLFSPLLALPDHSLLSIFLGISSGPFEATLAPFLPPSLLVLFARPLVDLKELVSPDAGSTPLPPHWSSSVVVTVVEADLELP